VPLASLPPVIPVTECISRIKHKHIVRLNWTDHVTGGVHSAEVAGDCMGF